ncbi:MAG: ADP-ribosylglycohydrolase family protein [Clostridia bacterium]|nr:ADP-ribosylglycohydrolase family protein [Clostridia bacterium]
MYINQDPQIQPDKLDEILALRPEGADAPAKKPDDLYNRMKGALVGRFAGCVLGIPVENYSLSAMESIAIDNHMQYPPVDYWTGTNAPDRIHYRVNKRTDYLKQNLDKVPVDDDITYTLLNLLLLEKYGKNYTVDDVGQLWLDILPYACTAEDEALHQLMAGTHAEYAANFNSYVEWIGAAIRADAFGYAEAGNPAAAAKLSYNDAYLSHRKNGIYGEMFCAASVAAAFTAKTPLDAVREGMKQIPKESELYQALEWAFSVEDQVTNYLSARDLVQFKFKGMHPVHTINNMCLIVFALMLGGNDFTKCIGNCVAMGLDNDCTGATVGSIVGACIGFDKIPPHWYENFNDTVATYITGHETFSLEDCVKRFVALNN